MSLRDNSKNHSLTLALKNLFFFKTNGNYITLIFYLPCQLGIKGLDLLFIPNDLFTGALGIIISPLLEINFFIFFSFLSQ